MKKFGLRKVIAPLIIAVPIAVLPSMAVADDTDTTPSDSHWTAPASEEATEAPSGADAPLGDSHW
ncbi:hypothetical protein ACFYO0_14705 [Streptomyces sp. NPDC006365]|uniref:hypothetical protein n=1 Tax=Streptomyces sp. NPDC006365 TaxID=3364744 RepID=UPI003682B91C